MQVSNPFKFSLGMGIRMRRVRSMGFVSKGITRAVKAFVPAHKGSLRDMIATADETYPDTSTIKFDSVESCGSFMWKITVRMWYTSQNG